MGPKKAEKLLAEAPSWAPVVKAFTDAKLTADDALKQARLARILRWDDWDKEKKEPILWTPPSAS
jgi:DNA polymerase-1